MNAINLWAFKEYGAFHLLCSRYVVFIAGMLLVYVECIENNNRGKPA